MSSAKLGSSGANAANVVSVLLGAQRLSVTSSLPIQKSEMHSAVGDQLAWTKGNIRMRGRIASYLSSEGDGEGRREGGRRRLRTESAVNGSESNATDGEMAVWEEKAESLYESLTTLAVALSVALLVQLLAHCAWSHCVNRRYYRRPA